MHAKVYMIEEAAQMFSLHVETLRRAYRRGDLKAAMIGRCIRVSEAELERYWVANGGGQLWNEPKTKKKAEPPEKATKARAESPKKKAKKKTTGKKAKA